MFTALTRLSLITLVLLSLLHKRIGRAMTNVGHLFFDLVMYHGKPGLLAWDTEPQFADGQIKIREVVDGLYRTNYVTFRVPNRWPIRDGRHANPALLFQIRAQAVELGLQVINVEWFTQTAAKIQQPLLAMDAVAARRVTRIERWIREYVNRSIRVDDRLDRAMRKDLSRGIVRRG